MEMCLIRNLWSERYAGSKISFSQFLCNHIFVWMQFQITVHILTLGSDSRRAATCFRPRRTPWGFHGAIEAITAATVSQEISIPMQNLFVWSLSPKSECLFFNRKRDPVDWARSVCRRRAELLSTTCSFNKLLKYATLSWQAIAYTKNGTYADVQWNALRHWITYPYLVAMHLLLHLYNILSYAAELSQLDGGIRDTYLEKYSR